MKHSSSRSLYYPHSQECVNEFVKEYSAVITDMV